MPTFPPIANPLLILANEVMGENPLVTNQHRNDIPPKVERRCRVLGVTAQAVQKNLSGKQIDARGRAKKRGVEAGTHG